MARARPGLTAQLGAAGRRLWRASEPVVSSARERARTGTRAPTRVVAEAAPPPDADLERLRADLAQALASRAATDRPNAPLPE